VATPWRSCGAAPAASGYHCARWIRRRSWPRGVDDLRPVLSGGGVDQPPPLTLVVASMEDKDVGGVVAALAASVALRGARIIATGLDNARALPADRLAAVWRSALPGARVDIIEDPGAALDAALDPGEGSAAGAVVVAGSLYLVGDARRRLVDDPDLCDPEVPPA